MPPTRHRFAFGRSPAPLALNRRRFLQTSAAALSGVALSNCARNLSNSSPSPSVSPSAAADDKTLRLYGWVNYTDDELLQRFEEKTGIKAIVDTYDSNEVMLSKMQAGGGSAYSIIYPSDYMVTQMVELEMLTPLDQSRLQGLDTLKTKWKNPVYDKGNAHSIPVVWGTTGLIYNPKIVEQDLDGWDYVWDNKDSLTRQVTLINDVREVMGATLRYLGYSFNSTKSNEIQAAYKKLTEIKPAIAAFLTNGWEDQLASGDIAIAMAYSTDALALMAEQPELVYSIPKTGASLWTDTMVIPKTAPNPEAAYEWLNFMLDPATSAGLVERQKIATPLQTAFAQLPPELKENESIFPPDAIIAKCEGVAPLDQKVSDLYDRYWTQLTSS